MFLIIGLRKGCVYPDESYRDKNEWHGHKGYDEIMVKQIYKAKTLWKKRKRQQAVFELGKGLHTLQDFYAHNIKLNGKTVSSRKAADGKFKVIDGKITLEKTEYNKYFPTSFINSANNYKSITNDMGVHARTADSPKAYFEKGVWKWAKGNSPRYTKAIKESKLYLQRAMKCFKDGSKLKLGKKAKVNTQIIQKSRYYKKLKL